MSKAEISIDLDDPRDYFEILEGDKFKNSKVGIKAEGKTLRVNIVSDNPKALISTVSSVIKQIRIIEQTTDVVKK